MKRTLAENHRINFS